MLTLCQQKNAQNLHHSSTAYVNFIYHDSWISKARFDGFVHNHKQACRGFSSHPAKSKFILRKPSVSRSSQTSPPKKQARFFVHLSQNSTRKFYTCKFSTKRLIFFSQLEKSKNLPFSIQFYPIFYIIIVFYHL